VYQKRRSKHFRTWGRSLYQDRSRCDSDNGRLPPFTNGLAPDAAVDEIEVMQKFDRFVYGIGIATDLEFDVFCNGVHWDFLL
jgi:hypothetical protein